MQAPKRLVQSTPRRVLAGLIVAFIVACLAVGLTRLSEVQRSDRQESDRMTTNMRVICLGRFLMEVPKDARVTLFRTRVHGFDVEVINETSASFKQALAERQDQIKAEPDQFGGNRNLESTREIEGHRGLAGMLFVHGRKVEEGTRARGLEIEHYRNEGISTEAWVHASGTSFILSADYYDPDQIDNLPRLVAKLIPSRANEIPDEDGFCIDQAYFRDPLSPDQGESLSMLIGLPGRPDVEIMSLMGAGIERDQDGLFKRHRESDASLSFVDRMRLSTIRAAPRELGGIPGEEVLVRVREKNGATVFSFGWEANGREDDVFQPQFSL